MRCQRKYVGGGSDHTLGDIRQLDRLVRLLGRDRRHPHRGDTAGNDEVEVTEIRRDVEGKAVPGDPIASMNADRRDLAIVDPDTGVRRAPRSRELVRRERLDEKFLNLALVPVQVALLLLQVDDGVADELSGPVKGDITAALDLEQLDALLPEIFGRREHMSALGRSPERDDRRMLDEQQHVLVDAPGNPRARDFALEHERVGIRLPAKIDDEELTH